MEEKPLSVSQVFAVSSVENLIFIFSDNPEYFFKKITDLIDENKIAEHKELMEYLAGLLREKGYAEYVRELTEKYSI